MKQANPNEIPKRAIAGESFHGESWYRCPWCNSSFEFYETWYSKDFSAIDERKNIYLHKCGHLIDMG